MESVKELRDWFVSKCKVTVAAAIITGGSSGQDSQSKYGGTLVTPSSIPQFIIPCSGDVSRQSSEDKFSQDDDVRSQTSDSSAPYSERNSPAISLSGSCSCLTLPKHPVVTRSAPVTPRQEHRPRIGGRNDRHSLTSIDTLRDDGSDQSMYAASSHSTYSLPRRSLGVFVTGASQHPPFSAHTLSMSPGTMHRSGGSGSGSSSVVSSRSWVDEPTSSLGGYGSPSFSRIDYGGGGGIGVGGGGNCIASSVSTNGRYTRSSCGKASAGQLSLPLDKNGPAALHLTTNTRKMDKHHPIISVSSPVVSKDEQGMSTEPSYDRNGATSGAINLHKNKIRGHNYFRRRSSLSDLNVDEANYLSDLACKVPGYKSAGPSPTPRRKYHTCTSPLIEQRAFSPSSPLSPSSSAPRLELRTDTSFTRKRSVSQLQAHLVAEFGELKFSFQYLHKLRQFRVLLIRAENLGGNTRSDNHINSFAKLSLRPGKLQKKVTDIIKHTRNPGFNKEFFFHNIESKDLVKMHLKIKLINKSKNLVAEFLGETCVHLSDYNLLIENRMWKDLGPKSSEADLGCMQTTILFQPWENRINATVEQAKGLRPNRLTGTVATAQQMADVLSQINAA